MSEQSIENVEINGDMEIGNIVQVVLPGGIACDARVEGKAGDSYQLHVLPRSGSDLKVFVWEGE